MASGNFYTYDPYIPPKPKPLKVFYSKVTGKKMLAYNEISRNKRLAQRIAFKEAMEWVNEIAPMVDLTTAREYTGFDYLYYAYFLRHGLTECERGKIDGTSIEAFFRERLVHKCLNCLADFPPVSIEFIYQNSKICHNCAMGCIARCQFCDNKYLAEDIVVDMYDIGQNVAIWVCAQCVRRVPKGQNTKSINWRGYSTKPIGAGRGKEVQSSRGWSVEIECYITDTARAAQRFAELPTTFGIHHDGSLIHDGRDNRGPQLRTKDGRPYTLGVEIQTPVLKGEGGEKYLRDICRALNYRDNAQVDHTCGLHAHIDMSDCSKDYEVLKRLMVLHWLYEPVIMSFLPRTRRANQYCQPLKSDYNYKKIAECKSLGEFGRAWYKGNAGRSRYDKKHPRYHGINFHSLMEQGHVEIRYHSGTTNPRKMMQWVNLHARIIDYCAGRLGPVQTTAQLADGALTQLGRPRSLSKLTAQLFNMLKLSDEAMEYLKARQERFLFGGNCAETDFIEKEERAEEPEEVKLQLSIAEYEAIINNPKK